MNDDGRAEAVIGTPGGAADTGAGGRAYVVFGRGETPTIDLSGWTAAAGIDGFLVSGRPGDRLGSSAASAGDVDGDGASDVLLGGQTASLLYGQDTTDPVDLTVEDERFATRLQRPVAAVGPAVVAAGADVDDDGTPDLAVAFPGQTGLELVTGASPARAYVLTPLPAVWLPATLSLDALPGELGRRYDALPTAGSAVAMRGGDEQTPGRLLLGTPGSFPSSQTAPGRLLTTDVDATSGEDPPSGQARAAAAAGSTKAKCKPRNIRYPYDEGFRPAPPETDLASCRRTVKNNRDVNQTIGRKGYKGAKLKLKLLGSQAGRKKHGGAGGNGRFRIKSTKPLKAGKHRLVDSFTNAIVDLEQLGRTNFKLTLPDGTVMGETGKDPTRPAYIEVLGRGCMNSVMNADRYVFIYLAAGIDPTTGYALEIRGFLPRSALQDNAFAFAASSNDIVIDSYWLPCGRRSEFSRVRDDPQTFTNPDFSFAEQYQSDRKAETCDKPKPTDGRYLGQFNPSCGVTLRNYVWPQYPPRTAGASNFPSLVLLESATTGVNGGGIPRAIINASAGVPVNVRDKIGYADPNVPCGQQFVASWNYVQIGPIWGWWPRKEPTTQTRQSPKCPKAPTVRLDAAGPGQGSGAVNPKGFGTDNDSDSDPSNGDPNGTQYRFRYQIADAAPVDLPEANAGKGAADVAVTTSALPTCTPQAREIRVALIARNVAATAVSDIRTYQAPACPPPPSSLLPIARMTYADPFNVSGAINPSGSPTTYAFEYRTITPDFDDSPGSPSQRDAGSGTDDVAVTDEPGCLFNNNFGIAFVRLRATNAAGTVFSNQLSFFTDCFDV